MINWNWTEDGRKALTAFITGALGDVILAGHLEWTKAFWTGIVIAGLRSAFALFEVSSVPANQVAYVKATADIDNVQKVVDEKKKENPEAIITHADVKE